MAATVEPFKGWDGFVAISMKMDCILHFRLRRGANPTSFYVCFVSAFNLK